MNEANAIAWGLLLITFLILIWGIIVWALRRPKMRILFCDPVSGRVRLRRIKPTGEIDHLLANGKTSRVPIDASMQLISAQGPWALFNERSGQFFRPSSDGPMEVGHLDYRQINRLEIDRKLNAWEQKKADFMKWLFFGLLTITIGGIIAFVVQKVG